MSTDAFGQSPAMNEEEMLRYGLLVHDGREPDTLKMTALGTGLRDRIWSFQTHVLLTVEAKGTHEDSPVAALRDGPVGMPFHTNIHLHKLTLEYNNGVKRTYTRIG